MANDFTDRLNRMLDSLESYAMAEGRASFSVGDDHTCNPYPGHSWLHNAWFSGYFGARHVKR